MATELSNVPLNPGNWSNAADIINENSSKINTEFIKLENATTKFKGYYTTELTLKAAHPSPKVGDTAWVGATYPGVVYRCDVAGTWLATTDVPPSNTVNLSEYATQDAVSKELASVQSELNTKNNAQDTEIAKKLAKADIVQELGNSETAVMSQKAVTENVYDSIREIFSQKNKYVSRISGEFISDIGYNSTDFIKIKEEREDIIVSGYIGGVASIYVFFDKDFNYLPYTYPTNTGQQTVTISKDDIPIAASYIRCTTHKTFGPKGYVSGGIVLSLGDIYSEVNELNLQVKNLKKINILTDIDEALPSGIKEGELYYNTQYRKVYKIINNLAIDYEAQEGDVFIFKGLPLRITSSGIDLDYPLVPLNKGIYYTYSEGVVTEALDDERWMGLKFDVKQGDVLCIKTLGGKDPRAFVYQDKYGNDVLVAPESANHYDILEIIECTVDGIVYVNCSPGLNPGVYCKSVIEGEYGKIKELTTDVSSIEEGIVNKVDLTANEVGYLKSYNLSSIWEQGHFTDDGVNGGSTAAYFPLRIRTKTFIDNRITHIETKKGYSAELFKYQLDDTFIEYTTGKSFELSGDYKYRIALMRGAGFTNITPDAFENIYLVSDRGNKQSFWKKNIDFGSSNIHGYYRGLGEDYSAFNSSTKTSEIYQAFDSLVDASNGYITKSILGVCSDGIQNVNLYTLKPPTESYKMITRIKPKILLLQAQHGFEKSSVFGAYYFIHDLINKWHEHPILDYIRHHVEIQIIPVANPYGFDKNLYKNYSGVNLNRNYLAEGTSQSVTDPSSDQYGGQEAFDQPETQYIRDWVLANKDALIFIDHHTNGSGKASRLGKITWHPYYEGGDDYFNHMFDVANYHICTITAQFNRDYNLNNTDDNLLFGYISSDFGETGTADAWVSKQGIIGVTFEGFNGFPNDVAAFSNDEKKANSELLGNYLSMILAKYSIVQ